MTKVRFFSCSIPTLVIHWLCWIQSHSGHTRSTYLTYLLDLPSWPTWPTYPPDLDSVTVSLFGFFLICQIVRRLPQPSESGCRIFDGPELKNMCLKEPFFGGLALPHIWNQYWEGFWGHRYITEELGGAFLSLYPTPVASNVWEAVFVQFWLQLDLFWKPDIFLLPLISAQSSFNTSVDTI